MSKKKTPNLSSMTEHEALDRVSKLARLKREGKLYLKDWRIPSGWPASADPHPYASDDLLIRKIMQKHGFTEEQAREELKKSGG